MRPDPGLELLMQAHTHDTIKAVAEPGDQSAEVEHHFVQLAHIDGQQSQRLWSLPAPTRADFVGILFSRTVALRSSRYGFCVTDEMT